MVTSLLAYGGGDIWLWTPKAVWLTGGCLALIAGIFVGWWIVERVRGWLG